MNLFTSLVRAEICNEKIQLNIEDLTPELKMQLYKLSSKHDLAHLAAAALMKQNLLGNDELSEVFLHSLKVALFRHEEMNYAIQQITDLFEREGIVFVPLKGAVINGFYPEKWMRTRCDIDILVKEEELERAKDMLVSQLGYKVMKYNYHDIAMHSPENVLLELHFRILENEDEIDKVLGRVWQNVHPVSDGSCHYEMNDEFLMFHTFAHMYYHFINGGCGVRFIADVWLMEKALNFDRDKLYAMCRECRLETFARYAEKLASVCFDGGQHDEVTEMMQMYIVTGGLFGSFESKIKARKTKTDGKGKYIMKRIFMPFHEMKASYPKLEKNPVLYPWYTVKRWLKVFNVGTVDSAVQEIKLNKNMEQASIDELKGLFDVLKGDK